MKYINVSIRRSIFFSSVESQKILKNCNNFNLSIILIFIIKLIVRDPLILISEQKKNKNNTIIHTNRMTGGEIYLITTLKLKFCEIIPILIDWVQRRMLFRERNRGREWEGINKTKWQRSKR